MPASSLAPLMTALVVAMAVGLLAQVASRSLNLPDIVLFMVAGIAIGPVGLDVFHFAPTSGVAAFIFTVGTVVMLYEGGRSLELPIVRRIWIGTLLLATLGVLVTTAMMTAVLWWLFAVPFQEALLIAAVLSSTDPAAIIPLFRQLNVRPRLAQLVQAESALNDAVSSALVLVLVASPAGAKPEWSGAIRHFLVLLGGGLVTGGIVSYVLNGLLSERHDRRAFFSATEHPALISLIIMLVSYLVATTFGASGFMAAFTAGLVSGNRTVFRLNVSERGEQAHENYLFTNATLFRMLIFVLLGSEINFRDVLAILGPGLLAMACFIFLARPATVAVALGVDRPEAWSLQEMALAAWVRETGVVPASLAGLLLAMRFPGSRLLSAVVFLAVLVTILVQSTTTAWWASRLGVTEV
jgi:cell volume regulation protein A